MNTPLQKAHKKEHYDLILVGSGVANATIARSVLEKHPYKAILMLEAGPKFQMGDRRLWWDYIVSGRRPYQDYQDRDGDNISEGLDTFSFPESRLMIRGGSTVHWGGWSLRFKEEDFNLRTNTNRGADWPIKLRDLEKYYKLAEIQLGVSGTETLDKLNHNSHLLPAYPFTAADKLMIDAFEASDIDDYAPMPVARFRKCMTTGTCKYCPVNARFSASFLIDELEKFENFEFVESAPVTRLHVSDKRTISTVEYMRYPTGAVFNASADKFVLGAGAIETPKLLLRSISKHWQNGIGNDNDLVGRYLISHPFLLARVSLPENLLRWQQELDFPTLMSRQFDTKEEQEQGKLFLFKSRSRPKVEIVKEMRNGKSRKELNQLTTGPMEFELQGFMEEFSNFHNRVQNGPGMNHLGLPQTRVGFSRNPDFKERSKQRLKLMEEIVKNIKGASFVKSLVREQRGDHAASTCRMADSNEHGVVDENLKVFETDNLYICSNAAFPSGGAVNPTLTLTALATRLGEQLR